MPNRAFFSYARADGKLANWLWRQLDSYRTPKDLVGIEGRLGPVPDRLHKVFRDRDDLSAGRHLDEALQAELENSERLVVLCTPTSAKSKWVNHEVETFLRLGREARIFPVIGAGEPDSGDPETECFPPALRGKGLLAADLREIRQPNGYVIGDGRDGGRLKLIAGMLGLTLDQLVQRERRRQRFVVGGFAAAAAVFACVAAAAVGFGLLAQERARENQRLAIAERDAKKDAEANADLANKTAIDERRARIAEVAAVERANAEALRARASASRAERESAAAVGALASNLLEAGRYSEAALALIEHAKRSPALAHTGLLRFVAFNIHDKRFLPVESLDLRSIIQSNGRLGFVANDLIVQINLRPFQVIKAPIPELKAKAQYYSLSFAGAQLIAVPHLSFSIEDADIDSIESGPKLIAYILGDGGRLDRRDMRGSNAFITATSSPDGSHLLACFENEVKVFDLSSGASVFQNRFQAGAPAPEMPDCGWLSNSEIYVSNEAYHFAQNIITNKVLASSPRFEGPPERSGITLLSPMANLRISSSGSDILRYIDQSRLYENRRGQLTELYGFDPRGRLGVSWVNTDASEPGFLPSPLTIGGVSGWRPITLYMRDESADALLMVEPTGLWLAIEDLKTRNDLPAPMSNLPVEEMMNYGEGLRLSWERRNSTKAGQNSLAFRNQASSDRAIVRSPITGQSASVGPNVIDFIDASGVVFRSVKVDFPVKSVAWSADWRTAIATGPEYWEFYDLVADTRIRIRDRESFVEFELSCPSDAWCGTVAGMDPADQRILLTHSGGEGGAFWADATGLFTSAHDAGAIICKSISSRNMLASDATRRRLTAACG